jgi:hypothetical protein
MAEQPPTPEPLMLGDEVALLFRVSERTIKGWARNDPDWIGAIRTPGGQWRFQGRRVREALREGEHARPRTY